MGSRWRRTAASATSTGFNGGYDYGGGYGYGNLPWNGSYYGGDWGRLSDEDIRQLRAKRGSGPTKRRICAACCAASTSIRRSWSRSSRRSRRLEDDRVYKDAKELQSLQSFATEGLKRLEFGLRRQVESGDEAVVLAGSDEVPDEFKKMVAEYYRSLGKTPR